MPPKPRRKEPVVRCDEIRGERFSAPQEDVFTHNWWEVFCFPYILCGRIWDCFVTLCAGTNQCLVYWMGIQWIVCKITQITTPNAIIFPYYFYMFCQVILLTAFFVLIWIWFGKSVLTAYFGAFYLALTDGKTSVANTSRLSFRRYCFKKSEIFNTAADNAAAQHQNHLRYCYFLASFFIDYNINGMFVYMDLFY